MPNPENTLPLTFSERQMYIIIMIIMNNNNSNNNNDNNNNDNNNRDMTRQQDTYIGEYANITIFQLQISGMSTNPRKSLKMKLPLYYGTCL